MHINVTGTMFIEEFRKMDRMDNFSYKGLHALFEHFEELEDDTGESIECDVIAICCDYSELEYDDVLMEYPDLFDAGEMIDMDLDEIKDYIVEKLSEETMVVYHDHDDQKVLFQVF